MFAIQNILELVVSPPYHWICSKEEDMLLLGSLPVDSVQHLTMGHTLVQVIRWSLIQSRLTGQSELWGCEHRSMLWFPHSTPLHESICLWTRLAAFFRKHTSLPNCSLRCGLPLHNRALSGFFSIFRNFANFGFSLQSKVSVLAALFIVSFSLMCKLSDY